MSKMKFSKELLKDKPKPINKKEMILYKTLEGYEELPLVVTPTLQDIDLMSWILKKKEIIEEKLNKHGGILFRGFSVKSRGDFNTLVEVVNDKLFNYMERTTPRTPLEGKVYTSTEFPREQTIAMHNELSYSINMPKKIWFYCETPPFTGGETPIADVRKVLTHIPAEIQKDFLEKGWMLVRNFGEGYGPSWQEAFNTSDKSKVEGYCRENEIQFEWKDAHRLRTRQVREAIKVTEKGERLWANHAAFYHSTNLSKDLREIFEKEFEEMDYPFQTFYGDGTPISDKTIEIINSAYQKEIVEFKWQQGDVLLLNNYLVAHGRNPFKGERSILVAMGE
jgi:alpha-ketoglutarate-dependent taurine dioxygenase